MLAFQMKGKNLTFHSGGGLPWMTIGCEWQKPQTPVAGNIRSGAIDNGQGEQGQVVIKLRLWFRHAKANEDLVTFSSDWCGTGNDQRCNAMLCTHVMRHHAVIISSTITSHTSDTRHE